MVTFSIKEHPEKGRIVQAERMFLPGELVYSSKIEAQASCRDMYSLQVAEDKHILLDEPANLFCHSCEPNLRIVDNAVGAFDFYARSIIQIGDELCWHYATTETEVVEDFLCKCGNTWCMGRMQGYLQLPVAYRIWLQQTIGVSKYLQSLEIVL